MITHYLKVAVRNLLKYRTQSLISILGMAFGFACFITFSIGYRVWKAANENPADVVKSE